MPTSMQMADGLADRIAELLNDHPDAYIGPPVVQEVTTSATGPAMPGAPFYVELTDEQGDTYRLVVSVRPA